jgi:glutaredoxin
MAEQLILYTTPGCDVCDRARSDLTADGTAFEERDVMKSKAWFDEVLKYSITVPVLIREGKAEVGWKGAYG